MTFFEKVSQLNAALERHSNRVSALPKIVELLKDDDVCREFFMKLEDATWVRPLCEHGFFDCPPTKEQRRDGTVRYSLWAQSKYLVKVADKVPADVVSILLNIQTNNYIVIEDMIGAALAMPASVAVNLVSKISDLIENSLPAIHVKSASKFCVRLADAGELEAAMRLAEALFAPVSSRPDASPGRGNEFWYKDGLKTVIPSLSERIPREFLPKLCTWLEEMIAQRNLADRESDSDSSYLWRPAIEEHAENSNFDVKGIMAASVANGFENATRSEALSLNDAVQILERRRFVVFKRIKLHLIRIFGDQDSRLVSNAILDRERFDDPRYKHEYALLVGQRLNLLSQEEQLAWFGWIDAGPDMSDFDDSIRHHLDRDATDEDRQGRINYWKFEKLHWVRKQLTGKRKEFYEQMLAASGEPEFADVNIRTTTRWGNESPMTVDQLSAMPFAQAIEVVCTWQPSASRRFGPTIEGLASTFERFVKANSKDATEHAMLLAGKRSIYVRYFLRAAGDAIRQGSEVHVKPVVQLCQWVIQHPIKDPSDAEHDGIDEKWQWTLDEISRLVVEICKAKNDGPPTFDLETLRAALWDSIDALVQRPTEPSITRDEPEPDPRLFDYRERGINSARGQALEAAFAYARWVATHLDESKKEVPGGFDSMPEILQLLEKQLSPENRTVEGMSTIGPEVGLLYWIDKNWLAANVDRLFDLRYTNDPIDAAAGWSAWNAFVMWVSPHSEYYRLFKSKYAFAVEQASKVHLEESDRGEPMHRLGKHLMLYYGNGVIELNDPIILQFLETANPKIRRNAVAFIGDSIAGEKEIPQRVIDRFMMLWEKYWQISGQQDAASSDDGDLFGTWFRSGKFPPQWSIDRLDELFRVNPKPEPDSIVVERLAEVSIVDIEKALRILEAFVENDVEGWRVQSWLEPAETILKRAMAAEDPVREQAEKLINHLGRRGYTKFGELLKPA